MINEEFNMNNILNINAHDKEISSLSFFPCGNIISVSWDKSIKIWDIEMNLIQKIENAHDKNINYIYVINNESFITCSNDLSIKIWMKNTESNKYDIYHIIENAHINNINKIIISSKGNLISCSWDKTTKIWELIKEKDNLKKGKNNVLTNNNEKKLKKYQNIITLTHLDFIYSILLIEDKNILLCSGFEGTNLWDLKTYESIKYLENAECYWNNALDRIDNDRIIIGGRDGLLKVISLNEKKVIKEINNFIICMGICVIFEKNVFLTCGWNKYIKIYNSINYNCINSINTQHKHCIIGINRVKDNFIYSYSENIQIWKF